MIPFPAINAPNLVTDNLNLNNSDPIPSQIPRNPQLPKRAFLSQLYIGNNTVTKICRCTDRMFVQTATFPLSAHRQYDRYRTLPMDRPGDLVQ